MRRIPLALTEQQINSIIKAILHERKRKGIYRFYKIRNAMLILFQYTLGLRPREATASKLQDINFSQKTFYIRTFNNKLRQQDYVYLPDSFIPKLKAYLKIRKKHHEDSDYLFPTQKGRGYLDRATYAKIFKKALSQAKLLQLNYIDAQGLNRVNYTPYSLRHSFCTKVYSISKDLKTVQLLARHRYLRSSEVYVHIKLEDRKIINSFFPI